MTTTRIIGIDPGIARMGYGIVEQSANRLRAVAFGCLETKPELSTSERLALLYRELTAIVQRHQPEVMVVEELFLGRNTTTAFTVGQARGVALLAGAHANLECAEYTPVQVKLAVAGYGRADKQQVQDMVRFLLGLPERPRPDDAADALAVAITHAHTARPGSAWDFLRSGKWGRRA
ncbi:MAG: crossover junction endodeoxyribonuclease RuvC [Alicyclobacillaceae bacterium]|nr:crossover junction endodeoxyribonuclease RuvC [Alicyclobacillaceae bacterium]